MTCDFTTYICTSGSPPNGFITVVYPDELNLCDTQRAIVGKAYTCGTDTATIAGTVRLDDDSLTQMKVPGTISGQVDLGTPSAGMLGNIMYLQWTSACMIILSLGIISFLLFMRRR